MCAHDAGLRSRVFKVQIKHSRFLRKPTVGPDLKKNIRTARKFFLEEKQEKRGWLKPEGSSTRYRKKQTPRNFERGETIYVYSQQESKA
mgnify:FL=1